MFPFDLLPLKFKFEIDELMMLFVALIIDGISLILLCFALDDFWILDFTAWFIIGAWSFMKAGHMPSRKGKNVGSKVMGRYIGVGLFEAIPYLGAFPTWTLYVYSIAKNGSDEKDAIKQEQATGVISQ